MANLSTLRVERHALEEEPRQRENRPTEAVRVEIAAPHTVCRTRDSEP